MGKNLFWEERLSIQSYFHVPNVGVCVFCLSSFNCQVSTTTLNNRQFYIFSCVQKSGIVIVLNLIKRYIHTYACAPIQNEETRHNKQKYTILGTRKKLKKWRITIHITCTSNELFKKTKSFVDQTNMYKCWIFYILWGKPHEGETSIVWRGKKINKWIPTTEWTSTVSTSLEES